MKAIKFQLDQFGRDALDEFVRRGRGSRSAAVRTASLYYLADRESGRPAWLVRRYATASGGAAVTARLDRETWQALQEEAERQNVSADDLTRHAVLYFLADVDSGRVGQRLENVLTDSDLDE
jgi:Arc/MetJ-type ribon-helix-helix transcriptional regulator